MPVVKVEGLEHEPRWYEAFKYRYTNVENGHVNFGRQYIGVRKGFAEDGYTYSSEDQDLDRDIFECDFIKTYEEFGTYADMLAIESTELRRVDAPNNPDYYNKSLGSTVITDVDYESVIDIFNRIQAGAFNGDPMLVSVLHVMGRIQVREKDQGEMAKIISDDIKSYGHTNKCEPVLIYGGIGKNGEDIIGDGNTTVEGAHRAGARTLPTIRIPNAELVGWGEGEFRALSNMMNRPPETRKKHAEKEDGVKYVVDLYKNNKVWDSPDTRKFLRNEMRYTGKETSRIMNDARAEIQKLDHEKTSSVIWMDMSPTGKYHYVAQEKAAELNPGQTYETKIWSSAKFNFDQTVNALMSATVVDPHSMEKHGHEYGRCAPYRTDPSSPWPHDGSEPILYNWDTFNIIVYHKDPRAKKDWDERLRDDVENKLNTFVRPIVPDIKIVLHEMEMELQNSLS
jgi:hypothetical protein